MIRRTLTSAILWSPLLVPAAAPSQEPRPPIPSRFVGKWIGESGMGESFTRRQTGTAAVITEFGHTIDRFEFDVAADGRVTGSGTATYRFSAQASANLIAAGISLSSELAGKTQKVDFTIKGTMSRYGRLQLDATPSQQLTLINAGQRQAMPAWNVFGGIDAEVELSGNRLMADAFGVTVIAGKTTKIAWRAKTQATFDEVRRPKLPQPEPDGKIPKAYVGRWKGSGKGYGKRPSKIGRADVLVDMGAVLDHFFFDVSPDGNVKGRGTANYWFDVSADARLILARQAPFAHLDGNVEEIDFDIGGTMSADGKLSLSSKPTRELQLINNGKPGPMGAWNVFGGIEGAVRPSGQELLVKAAGTLDALKMKFDWKAKKTEFQIEVELKGTVKPRNVTMETTYERWYPQGDKDEKTPANDLNVRATLLTWDGRPVADGLVKKFTFELIDVSTVPGVCMNWPPKDKATRDPDLRFDKDRNFLMVNVVGPNGDTAEVEGSMTKADAVISSYDWGGYGYLKVTAELHDNRGEIVGYLKGDPNLIKIPIPKRRPNSKVADYARQRMNAGDLPDDDDNENEPVGNGFKGDGLTLYEEYRGFYEDRKHVRGDLKKKDLFICVAKPSDLAYFERGIKLFEGLSELKVRYKLRKDELVQYTLEELLAEARAGSDAKLGMSRVINFNHADPSLHRVNQHALVMAKGTLDKHTMGMTFGLGPPKYTSGPVIDAQQLADFAARNPGYGESGLIGLGLAEGTIAHELCHAVGIDHHGTVPINNRSQGDYLVRWVITKKPDDTFTISEWRLEQNRDGTFTIEQGRTPIKVLTENGREVSPAVLWGVASQDSSTGSADRFVFEVPIGAYHGEHSGNAGCIVRYDYAWAYVAKAQPNVRYWVRRDDQGGFGLCDNPKGTGVNAPGHPPQPRYGDSVWAKGCKGQIVVNDAYERR
jgi:hypothetical protein